MTIIRSKVVASFDAKVRVEVVLEPEIVRSFLDFIDGVKKELGVISTEDIIPAIKELKKLANLE